MTEKYYLNYGEKEVSRKEAMKNANWVLEVSDIDLTTKNEAPECPVLKEKEKATK